jgi:hypothetical protein
MKDSHAEYLRRATSADFDPEKDVELVRDDEVFYLEELLKHGLVEKGPSNGLAGRPVR